MYLYNTASEVAKTVNLNTTKQRAIEMSLLAIQNLIRRIRFLFHTHTHTVFMLYSLSLSCNTWTPAKIKNDHEVFSGWRRLGCGTDLMTRCHLIMSGRQVLICLLLCHFDGHSQAGAKAVSTALFHLPAGQVIWHLAGTPGTTSDLTSWTVTVQSWNLLRPEKAPMQVSGVAVGGDLGAPEGGESRGVGVDCCWEHPCSRGRQERKTKGQGHILVHLEFLSRLGLGWDPRACVQFGLANFGVFSTSCFAPLGLCSDWITGGPNWHP